VNLLQQQLQAGLLGFSTLFCDRFFFAGCGNRNIVVTCGFLSSRANCNGCMHIAFVVGLERVAEELMGRRKWKQYQDAVLKTPLKVDTEDWEPQDKCCMCDGRPFLDLATVSRSLNQIFNCSPSAGRPQACDFYSKLCGAPLLLQ